MRGIPISHRFSIVVFLGLAVGLSILGSFSFQRRKAPNAHLASGMVYSGLRKSGSDAAGVGQSQASVAECGPGYEVVGVRRSDGSAVLCTHGPDAAPSGIDVRLRRGPVTASESVLDLVGSQAASCLGSGTDGRRIQAVYAHFSDQPDRFSTYAPQFKAVIQSLDSRFYSAGQAQAKLVIPRWVTDSSCQPVISNIAIAHGDNSYSAMLRKLQTQGYNRADRIYLVWMDDNLLCGLGSTQPDDSAGQSNLNNTTAAYARIDNGCWALTEHGLLGAAEAHELMHTLGAVQPSAPHATSGQHCTDGISTLCRGNDGTATHFDIVCSDEKLDCNYDDYFNASPPPGSYLATHWNTAFNGVLSVSAQSTAISATPAPTPKPKPAATIQPVVIASPTVTPKPVVATPLSSLAPPKPAVLNARSSLVFALVMLIALGLGVLAAIIYWFMRRARLKKLVGVPGVHESSQILAGSSAPTEHLK